MVSQDKSSQKNSPPKKSGRGKNPARRVAANMLAAILRGKTLDEARDKLEDLRDGERNLADAIVQTSLRHYGSLEILIRSYVKKMPPRASPARALLFIGAAQLVHMNVPTHAALNETVAATGRREQPYRGMINAVLRNIARAQEADKLPAFEAAENIPAWLRENWLAAYGAENLTAIAEALAVPAVLDLCFKNPEIAQGWAAKNTGEAVSPTHIRLPESTDVTALDGFAEGVFWVQNAAAGSLALMLNEALLAQNKTADILDLCAAPGGKTLQLTAAGHGVTALDMSQNRLKRLRDNLARTRLKAEIICADGPDWLGKDGPEFDAILLDAPCTATGTLRRHPDLLRHRHSGDMEKLVAVQAEFLNAAAPRVKAGGYLAYGVCAIQPEEGRDQIEDFLLATPAFQKTEEQFFLPSLAAGGDGFYAALLKKAE